jgi:hypothetical protein
MADKSTINFAENSVQKIALDLTEMIAKAERRTFHHSEPDARLKDGWITYDRQWLLDTYAECLDAVTGSRRYAR